MQHTTQNPTQKLIAFLSFILLLVLALFVVAMTMKIGQNLAAIFDAAPVEAAPGDATAEPVITNTPAAEPTPAAPTRTPSPPTATPLPVETPVVETPTTEATVPHLIAGESGVNVRNGPGTDYDKIGLLLPGDEVLIEGYSGDWWAVTFNGGRGWVYNAIVTAFHTEGAPEQPAPPLPTPEPKRAAPTPEIPVWAIDEWHWIDVDLSEQRLTAFESQTPVQSYLVSTGLPQTPTPVGQYRIWIKLPLDDMAGADYYIKDVPWVMYFHQGYGLHGVTWHANFGHPMSHGCVNQPNDMAEWLFNFAEVGTLVNVHE